MIELFENGGIEVHNNVKARAYGGLTFVVFIWGISPLLTLRLYRYYSPAFRLFLAQLVLLPAYLLISGRHLREINASYIRVGMITGLFLASVTLVSSALCWTVRTNSMKHVEASAVAVIMPFSAVIISTASVICRTERLTVRLVLGGLICLGAIFMSSLGDIKGKAQDCGADSPQF